MGSRNRFFNSLLSVILILSITLTNAHVVLADEGPTPEPTVSAEPTEEPIQPTVEPTEPPIVATESPVVETPVPTEAAPVEEALVEEQEAPITELLTQAPENTDLVVLDENGQAIPLTSQEALNTILETDPMWCPAGVLPGGVGCTTNFATINLLIADMIANTGTYDENGIIYFTSTPGASFSLTSTTLSTDYTTLSNFNLTLQGGWNGLNGASATFTSQTNFGSNTLTIGSSGNPWAGNITLNNFSFSGVSSSAAVTVYTTSGNITLDNIDVSNQTNNTFTATLNSTTGNITVQNGSTFDGNTGNQSQGFSATTGSGAITISDTIFSDSVRNGTPTYDGATLSASTITLTNVTAQNNDGDGITINNANTVTLNNVTATGNGTESGAAGLSNNDGSGVFINGNSGSSVYINGGTFTNNQEYGVEIATPANTTIYVQSNPTCTGNDSNAAPTSSCYNDTTITDTTAPVITPAISGTAGSNGWYTSNVTVSWTTTDAESGIQSSNGCTTSNLTSETTGTTLTCSATNNAGLSSSNSVTIKIDKTAPTASLSIVSGTLGNNGWYTSDVVIQTAGTDTISTPVTCTANQSQTSDTTATIFNGSCTNNAGLSTNATPLTIKVDKTGPTAVLTVIAGTAGMSGWYRSDVTIQTTGADSTSGLATCTANQFQTTETSGTTFNGSCTNNAGLTTNAAALTIKLDKTNPVITFVNSNPAANANGWIGTNVTVNWSCADSLSSPVSATVNQTITTEGANQSATGTCQDLAGNVATNTQSGFNIDKNVPTATAVVSPAPNANGWNNTNVTVTFTGTDTGSGIATCSPAITISTQGAGQSSSSGTCTDLAGNVSAPVSATGINIDKGLPSITFKNSTPAPNANGWYKTNVTVNWTCKDSLSGPVNGTVSQIISTEGANQSATGLCLDKAGNSASHTQSGFNIDKTAPTLNLPSNITVEATSPAGAVVNYSASASDNLDPAPAISCLPASGSTFVIGTTMVNCSANDHADNTAFGNFNITVQDSAAPIIAFHADVTAEATSASGANVSYASPGTSDAVDGAGTATCSPASGGLFALGDTTITCTATDSNGNAAIPTTFVIHVVDTTAPVIAAHADVTVEATSASGSVVTYTNPTTTDVVDGAGTSFCSPSSGETFALGNTTVTCTAADSHGNVSTPATFVVHVVDTTAPLIASHADVTVEATSSAGAAVTYSNPTTSDVVDGSGTATCAPASGATFAIGNTTVTCNATDSHGNAAVATNFTVHVVDTTAPVIAPHADVFVPATSALGAVVNYSTPATTDAVDGTGVANCAPASGSQFPIGNTTVTCNATDTHGNAAASTSFVVHVVDTAAPVIDGHLDVTIEATSASGALATYNSPATSDVVDGPGVATCSPGSGTFFVFGDTTVTCTATDSNGNAATPTTFIVHVVDTTAPSIASHADVTAEATSAAGATVTYSNPSTSDIVDGAGVASCSPASGSTFALGNTTVTCTATDSNGNAAPSTSFVVHVVDTTAPIISAPGDITVFIDNLIGTIVSYSAPVTSDAVDGSGTATCSPFSGSFFSLGDTLITCNASDSHGNAAQPVTFTIHVVYQAGAPAPTTETTRNPQNGLSIPVTSGLLDLDCLTVINSFGVQVTFHNLCDYQAAVTEAPTETLPAPLPEEYSFVQGLNVLVLLEEEVVKALPTGTGVQLDFSIPADTQDEYDVLLWDDKDGDGIGEWLKVTRLVLDQDLSKVMLADPTDELYQIARTETLDAFYRIITTEKTGTFVLVKN